MLALPAAVALWILAIPLISTLYQYGRFSVEDVLQTRTALLGYSVGLLGLIVVKILAPGFYARQVMSTPVKIAFATVLVSQTFALILMRPLGHAGLTLSTSIGACFNAALLFWFLKEARDLHARSGLAAVRGEARRSRCSCSRPYCSGSAGPRPSGSRRRHGRRSADCGRMRRGAAAYFGALWLLGFRLADFNRRDISATRGCQRSRRWVAGARSVGLLALRYGQRGFTQSA